MPLPGHRRTALDALALATLLALALAAWWPLLGGAQLRALPAILAAALVVLGVLAPRHVLAALALWWLVALPIGGAPVGALWPSNWDRLGAGISGGASGLERLASGSPLDGPWPLALALLGLGTVALLAAALVRGPGPRRLMRPLALALLLAPWAIALTVRQGELPPWQGAVAVVAALVWLRQGAAAGASQRLARPLAAALAIGILAAVVGHAAAPQQRWLAVGDVLRRQAPLRTLEVEPTYGPLEGRRSGATMLEVRAARPGLWRMQTLDLMTVSGWRIRVDEGAYRPLPQPAAIATDVEVRVRRLRSALVVAPGAPTAAAWESDAASIAPTSFPGPGESRRLRALPGPGDRYTVTADVVDPTLGQLRRARPPRDARLAQWTAIGRPFDVRRYGGVRDGSRGGGRSRGFSEVPLFGLPRDALLEQRLDQTLLAPVAAISRRLVRGSRTQIEAVQRVVRYLRDRDRFTYDTDLPAAGLLPIVEFLTETRRGYCQHFAGAAGMLLRLAGIPTRVVSGFATGTETDPGVFDVRDVDAHQWIEVYFTGIGWVPFDPTPPGDATVDPRADPLQAAVGRDAPGGPGATIPALLLVAVAGGWALVAVRRRRASPARGPRWDGLALLARRAGVVVLPSTTASELARGLQAIGPRTAALARDVELAAYGPPGTTAGERPSGGPGTIAIVRALVADRGPWGATAVLLGAPARTALSARRRPGRRRRPAAPGDPRAGR